MRLEDIPGVSAYLQQRYASVEHFLCNQLLSGDQPFGSDEAALEDFITSTLAPAPESALVLREKLEHSIHVLPIGCPCVDDMLGGGMFEGSLLEVTGETSSGKTQLCHMAAASTAGSEATVHYIDTTNSFSAPRLAQIASVLQGCNSAEVVPTLSRVHVHRVHSAHAVLSILSALSEQLVCQKLAPAHAAASTSGAAPSSSAGAAGPAGAAGVGASGAGHGGVQPLAVPAQATPVQGQQHLWHGQGTMQQPQALLLQLQQQQQQQFLVQQQAAVCTRVQLSPQARVPPHPPHAPTPPHPSPPALQPHCTALPMHTRTSSLAAAAAAAVDISVQDALPSPPAPPDPPLPPCPAPPIPPTTVAPASGPALSIPPHTAHTPASSSAAAAAAAAPHPPPAVSPPSPPPPKVSLLIIDSLSAVISPLLGMPKHSQGHTLLACIARMLRCLAQEGPMAVLLTTHAVRQPQQHGGPAGVRGLGPAMGESWRNQVHMRLQLQLGPLGAPDQPRQAILTKCSFRAVGETAWFAITAGGLQDAG